MVRRGLTEAASAMRGELIAPPAAAGAGDAYFEGAAIDSRRVTGGELFFALPGSRVDGHRFVPQALAAGAAAAVVHRDIEGAEGTLIRVEDSYRALHALTNTVRRQVPERLVGLTGSVGKTTTKELLAAMLAQRYRVAASPGNLNNLYGFPLALLGIPDETEWMVAELGMSTPGELRQVSWLALPDIALLTCVRPAHLENFPSVAAIADAKAEVFQGLAPDGLVAANADDPEVERVVLAYRSIDPGEILWYSAGGILPGRSNSLLGEPEPLPGGGYRFRLSLEANDSGLGTAVALAGGVVVPYEEVTIELPLHGSYNVENCLAAATVAHALGVTGEQIAAAVAAIGAPPGRGRVHRPGAGTARGITLIDDSYNSSPAAVSGALASAAALPLGPAVIGESGPTPVIGESGPTPRPPRRWAVLGEMLELGETAPELHRRAGAEAAAAGFTVVGVGPLARHLVAGAAAAGAAARWFEDVAEVAAWLPDRLAAGDLVLVKGSRKVELERLVEHLLAERQPDERLLADGEEG